jgi:N-acetylglucosaminyldiphosphoundecaprenol N-acetyl-beta-D-mannosaminyltransferase
MNILGVDLVATTKEKVLREVQAAFRMKQNLRIATVNPEYLLAGQGNEAFRLSLANADIRTVDGFGIQLVAWLRGFRLPRVTGADLIVDLLTFAEQENIPVVINNKPAGLSSDADILETLKTSYPKLFIQVVSSSYRLSASSYQLIFCTYGAPEQELFLDTLETPGIKVGIGGALDYLTGKQSRAPRVLQSTGLEWLWRLVHQPKRLGRIIRAVVIFPITGIIEGIKEKYGR